MSKLDNAPSGSHETDTPEDAPVLLYDAGCSMCNELAYKVRERANGPLRLVALSDPEADELLSQHYSGSWSKDFYFVDDGTARKGKRALPAVMKTVGVKDFTTLVGDYLQHVRNDTGGCEHEESNAGSRLSRRSFVGTAAAAGTALFTGSAAGSTFQSRPPRGLDVTVARVSPDGVGGFDVSIERDSSLIRTEQWDDDAADTAGESPVSMNTVDTRTLAENGTLQIQRQETEIVVTDDSKRLDEAFAQSGSSSPDTGKMTRYGVVDDRERYGFSLNFAEAPLKKGDSEIVGTTLSGRIKHDVARKTVDFVKFESGGPENLESHLEGYVAALRAYAGHYEGRGDVKMSQLYSELASDLAGNVPAIVDSHDGEYEPVQNVLAVSSVPNWTEYVESPSTDDPDRHQSDEVTGADCGCSCCSLGCCTGCDCGCSVCIGTPRPGCGCGCCIGGCGGGCGCGCCYCIS